MLWYLVWFIKAEGKKIGIVARLWEEGTTRVQFSFKGGSKGLCAEAHSYDYQGDISLNSILAYLFCEVGQIVVCHGSTNLVFILASILHSCWKHSRMGRHAHELKRHHRPFDVVKQQRQCAKK